MADDRDLLLEEEDLPSPAPTPAPTPARNPQHADPVHDAKREELAKRERQIQDLLSTIAAERNRDVKSLSNILDSNYKTSQQKQDQLLAAIETLRKRDILWVRVGKGLGVVLALLFVLQAVVWLAAPKVAPATDKSIYDGLRIDTTSRPGEVWVYSENNSWIKDMEQKVDDEKLRNGWCKALIKK